MDELFALYQKAMASLGYDRLVFSLMTDHPTIDRKAGHGIISNYPSDWMAYYGEKNFAPLDPVRAGMYATVGPFLWGEMEKTQPLTRAQMLFMNEAQEAGLHSGIGIPLRGVMGAIAGVGAASSNSHVEADPFTLAKAHMYTSQFYNVFLALEAREVDVKPVYLSDREREVLQLTACGMTFKDIARALNVSPHTVRTYKASILKKFGVKDITVAALRASRQYLIQAV
ncbi:MAG TPA: LuxR family transcriptional regulator [Patescibacteria group bacterium]|nr:LuxR family transcriptional regulator [Patescibacteria group bacterium]